MKEKKGNLYFLWVSNSKGSCLFGGSSMFPPEEDRAGEVGGHLADCPAMSFVLVC